MKTIELETLAQLRKMSQRLLLHHQEQVLARCTHNELSCFGLR